MTPLPAQGFHCSSRVGCCRTDLYQHLDVWWVGTEGKKAEGSSSEMLVCLSTNLCGATYQNTNAGSHWIATPVSYVQTPVLSQWRRWTARTGEIFGFFSTKICKNAPGIFNMSFSLCHSVRVSSCNKSRTELLIGFNDTRYYEVPVDSPIFNNSRPTVPYKRDVRCVLFCWNVQFVYTRSLNI